MKVTALRVGEKGLVFGWNPERKTFVLTIEEDGNLPIHLGEQGSELSTYAEFERQLLSHVPLTEMLRQEIETLKTEQLQAVSAGKS